MSRFYETRTSRRLGGYARARGLDWSIAFTADNGTGRYHVIAKDGKPLHYWVPLGWSEREARERIEQESALDDLAERDHDALFREEMS